MKRRPLFLLLAWASAFFGSLTGACRFGKFTPPVTGTRLLSQSRVLQHGRVVIPPRHRGRLVSCLTRGTMYGVARRTHLGIHGIVPTGASMSWVVLG